MVAAVIAFSASALIFCRFTESVAVNPSASASDFALALIVAMVFSKLSPLSDFSSSSCATRKALSAFRLSLNDVDTCKFNLISSSLRLTLPLNAMVSSFIVSTIASLLTVFDLITAFSSSTSAFVFKSIAALPAVLTRVTSASTIASSLPIFSDLSNASILSSDETLNAGELTIANSFSYSLLSFSCATISGARSLPNFIDSSLRCLLTDDCKLLVLPTATSIRSCALMMASR